MAAPPDESQLFWGQLFLWLTTVSGFLFQWFIQSRNRRWAKEDHDRRAKEQKEYADERARELREQTDRRAEELKKQTSEHYRKSDEERAEIRRKVEDTSKDVAVARAKLEEHEKFDAILAEFLTRKRHVIQQSKKRARPS